MGDTVLAALIGLAGIAIGYALKPLADLLSDATAARRAREEGRRAYQRETLHAAQDELIELVALTLAADEDQAADEDPARRSRLRMEKLAIRIADDTLRGLLEALTVEARRVRTPAFSSQNLRESYDAARVRLGEVLRDL